MKGRYGFFLQGALTFSLLEILSLFKAIDQESAAVSEITACCTCPCVFEKSYLVSMNTFILLIMFQIYVILDICNQKRVNSRVMKSVQTPAVLCFPGQFCDM